MTPPAMIDCIIAKTAEYLSVPSVVGHEGPFLDFLERDFKALGLQVYKTKQYISVCGEDPLSACLCAHLDRHGLISIGGEEYVYAAQYMKEVKYGENNRLAIDQIQSITERFEGEMIYAYDPVSGERIGEGRIEACDALELGGDALFHVPDMPAIDQGIPLAYARTACFENGRLRGQIDNALSLAVIYALFRDGFQGTAILSTEEEIGKSWLHCTPSAQVGQIVHHC